MGCSYYSLSHVLLYINFTHTAHTASTICGRLTGDDLSLSAHTFTLLYVPFCVKSMCER